MTVEEWVDFNWRNDENGHCINNIGDIFVTILDGKSYNAESIVISGLVSINRMHIFNDYNILSISIGEEKTEYGVYTTLKISIYKESVNENE